jgi:hypothetical protein
MPRLLPAAFRERFPPHGIELRYPGLLDRTPITAVPMPHWVDPYEGPPPADLVGLGIAPPDAALADRVHTPHLVLPVDADGLPNLGATPAADVLLVGDSFAVYGSQREPSGLQTTLERAFAEAKVCNLGMSSTGPLQHRWLLEHFGLPRRPRLVLWFFFGGNDLLDAQWFPLWQAQGVTTWGELHADCRAPRLWLPHLVASFFTAAPQRRLVEAPLPGLARTRGDGREWFYPDSLRITAAPAELLRASPGFVAATAALREAVVLVRAAGAEFQFVFVPSKEQVLLGHVQPDAPLLARYATASRLAVLPIPAEPAALAAVLLQNRGNVEQVMREFCASEGIAFWSATPVLDALAADGGSGYYTADTHWHGAGQRAVAEALLAHRREREKRPR